ncbi:MAG: TylF/MycF/NovP-related O-methyltransferase [Acidobacteriota bacterium]
MGRLKRGVASALVADSREEKLVAQVRPYTMSDPTRLANLHRLVEDLEAAQIPGDLVECGVCNGGSAALMAATVTDSKRRLWLYDTFEGIPEAGPEDGEEALRHTGDFVGNTHRVHEVLGAVGWDPERCVWREGLFGDTLLQPLPEQIALLHIDADWYDSVMETLEALYPRVSMGGAVVLDDFGHWEGARRAFYDFCSRHGLQPMLERRGYTQAHWWKGDEHTRHVLNRPRRSDHVP